MKNQQHKSGKIALEKATHFEPRGLEMMRVREVGANASAGRWDQSWLRWLMGGGMCVGE